MNPRLYFDEKTLKKLGDVFVVNTYFPIKTVPDSADYFLLVYIAHSNAIHNIDNTSRKLKEGDVVLRVFQKRITIQLKTVFRQFSVAFRFF